jgi:hypothetical protein
MHGTGFGHREQVSAGILFQDNLLIRDPGKRSIFAIGARNFYPESRTYVVYSQNTGEVLDLLCGFLHPVSKGQSRFLQLFPSDTVSNGIGE